MNILRLPELTIVDTRESGPDLHVYVEVAQKPTQCARCGSTEIVGYGRRQQRFMDLPAQAQRVGIYVNRRRLKCRSCGQTFSEPVPYMDDKHKMTIRLREYIQKQAIVRTFTSVASDVGVDEKTVRNIFADFSADSAGLWGCEAGRYTSKTRKSNPEGSSSVEPCTEESPSAGL